MLSTSPAATGSVPAAKTIGTPLVVSGSADTYWFTDPNIHSQWEGGALLNGATRPLSDAETRLAANYGYTIDRMRYLDGLDGEHQPIYAFVEVGWPFTETAAQGG